MATFTFFALATSAGQTVSGDCSGFGNGNTTAQADTTGPPGEISFLLGSSATDALMFSGFTVIRPIPGVGNWAGGTYEVTVEVVSTNMNLTLTQIRICRYNSSMASPATVGSLTGIGRSLASAGAVAHNVTGSAQSGATDTDRLAIMLVGSNSAMSSQSVGLKVTIATPISDGAASFDAAVTDANPAQTDSATATWEPAPTEAAVTDSNPAQSDSATATHTAPVHSAAVTDSNPVQDDSSTATHAAPVIEASVTDSNPAQADSAEASFAAQLHEASVTDSNPAQTDASTASYAAPVFDAAVTDVNPAQSDAAAVQQLIDEVTASVTDQNPAQSDSAALTFAGPAEIDDLQAVAVSSSQIDLSWTGVL